MGWGATRAVATQTSSQVLDAAACNIDHGSARYGYAGVGRRDFPSVVPGVWLMPQGVELHILVPEDVYLDMGTQGVEHCRWRSLKGGSLLTLGAARRGMVNYLCGLPEQLLLALMPEALNASFTGTV